MIEISCLKYTHAVFKWQPFQLASDKLPHTSTISNDAKVQRGISRWSYCRTFFNDLFGHDCEWTLVQRLAHPKLYSTRFPPDGYSMNAFMPNIWFGCLNSSFLVNPFWFPEMDTLSLTSCPSVGTKTVSHGKRHSIADAKQPKWPPRVANSFRSRKTGFKAEVTKLFKLLENNWNLIDLAEATLTFPSTLHNVGSSIEVASP